MITIVNGKIFCYICGKWIEAAEMVCKAKDIDKTYCNWYCACGELLIMEESI